MTNDQLNQLFDSARSIPAETSAEEIASWVGIAATSTTGVLGIAGKLKLLIAKKTFIMVGTSLSIISAGVITAITLTTAEPPVEKESIEANKATSISMVTPPETDEIQLPEVPKTIVPTPIRNDEVFLPSKPLSPLEFIPEPLALMMTPRAPQAPAEIQFASPADSSKKVKASGNVIKKEYAVGDFSKLNISGFFNVVLRQGDAGKVVIEADDNLQHMFSVKTANNTLSIDMNGIFDDKKVNTIHITFEDLKKINFDGVGDITSEGPIKLNSLECLISGVGNMNLTMDCDDLNMNFSGVGNVTLAGNGSKATYNWSGVGDLKAASLVTKDVTVALSGVGDANVNATQKIDVNLSGIGDVKYSGSPQQKELKTSGMGKIKGT